MLKAVVVMSKDQMQDWSDLSITNLLVSLNEGSDVRVDS